MCSAFLLWGMCFNVRENNSWKTVKESWITLVNIMRGLYGLSHSLPTDMRSLRSYVIPSWLMCLIIGIFNMAIKLKWTLSLRIDGVHMSDTSWCMYTPKHTLMLTHYYPISKPFLKNTAVNHMKTVTAPEDHSFFFFFFQRSTFDSITFQQFECIF